MRDGQAFAYRLAGRRSNQRQFAGGIKNDNAGGLWRRRQFVGEIAQSEGFVADISIGLDWRINGNEIGLAVPLRAVAGKIDEGCARGAAGCDLVEKIAQRLADGRLLDVVQFGDIVAGRAQGLRDDRRVGGRSLQRRDGGVGTIADDQRVARLRERATV